MSVTESDAMKCMNIVEFIKPKVERFLKDNMCSTNWGTKLLSSGKYSNLNCKQTCNR